MRTRPRKANVRAAIPAVEAYNADNVSGAPSTSDPDFATSNTDSGYSGMTVTELKTSYDQAFPTSVWVNSGDASFPSGVTMPAATPGATSPTASSPRAGTTSPGSSARRA